MYHDCFAQRNNPKRTILWELFWASQFFLRCGGSTFSFLCSASLLVTLFTHVLLWGSSAAKSQAPPLLLYPWIMDCAKSGRVSQNGSLPEEGTIHDALLSCMLESSVTDGFTDEELSLRSTDLDWCFPPSFLSASSTCQAEGFDPYKFLFPCFGLDGFPKLDKFTFYYELPANDDSQNTPFDSFANDTVIVIDSLIGLLCSFLDAIRSPAGVMCLTDVCRTVSASPSTIPSNQPSVIPSDQPSMTPSIEPSVIPSVTPTNLATIPASPVPNILCEGVSSAEPVQEPSKRMISLEALPSLAVQIEILIKFVIEGVRTTAESAHSESFLETLKESLDLTFAAEVSGHKSVDVVKVSKTTPTTVETVIIAIGRRECRQCSASWVSNKIIADYVDELRNANSSGGLTHQIEFQAFIRDVEPLFNITINGESVGLLASSNSTRNGLRGNAAEASAAVTWDVLYSGITNIVFAVVVSSAVGN